MTKKRIGILTGGGDCPGLNAVIRAVTKHAIVEHGWSVVGIEDGYAGLYEKRYEDLDYARVTGLLSRGGTILGSSNRADPFAYPVKQADGSEVTRDVSEDIMQNLKALDLECLVAVGGDGTMFMSQKLAELGARVVGVPKTIDNDLWGTDTTFGFQTAVEVAVDAIDRLHTTAESHDRVMICEVMGRYGGWIALHAGLAGGADVILIPEIEYDLERITAAIRQRKELGATYTIIVMAEGAKPRGGEVAVKRKGDATVFDRLGGAAERLAQELGLVLGHHVVRATVLGHVQRGGTPSAYDRVLATRYGKAAVDLIAHGKIGHMVTLVGTEMSSMSLTEVRGKQKLVDPDGELVTVARATGVEMGA